MRLPYRARRTFRGLFITVLIIALVAALAALCWLLWLNRYVVYTKDGVKLDFGLSLELPEGQTPSPPTPGPSVDIYYNEGENAVTPETTELERLEGVYITEEMLEGDFSALLTQVQTLPNTAAVMLDVKNVRGDFFYPTTLGQTSEDIDTQAVKELVDTLHDKGYYIIAKLPAFRDYWYFLADERTRVPYGLPRTGGSGSLWLDSSGPNYWFNPSSEGTMTYLIQIISELRSMGFDEVVFDDFRFPDTDKVSFSGDKAQTIRDTAATLVKSCTTDTFAVSFLSTDASFPLPEGRSRLYLKDASAADLETLAGQTGLTDPEIRLVFLTDLMDTRFDTYSVMRPLSTG